MRGSTPTPSVVTGPKAPPAGRTTACTRERAGGPAWSMRAHATMASPARFMAITGTPTRRSDGPEIRRGRPKRPPRPANGRPDSTPTLLGEHDRRAVVRDGGGPRDAAARHRLRPPEAAVRVAARDEDPQRARGVRFPCDDRLAQAVHRRDRRAVLDGVLRVRSRRAGQEGRPRPHRARCRRGGKDARRRGQRRQGPDGRRSPVSLHEVLLACDPPPEGPLRRGSSASVRTTRRARGGPRVAAEARSGPGAAPPRRRARRAARGRGDRRRQLGADRGRGGWAPCRTSVARPRAGETRGAEQVGEPDVVRRHPERERARPTRRRAGAPASPAGAPVSIASTMITRRASAICGSSSRPAVPPSTSSTSVLEPVAVAQPSHRVDPEAVVGAARRSRGRSRRCRGRGSRLPAAVVAGHSPSSRSAL